MAARLTDPHFARPGFRHRQVTQLSPGPTPGFTGLRHNPQLLTDLRERRYRNVEIGICVVGIHLGPDPGGAVRHDRKRGGGVRPRRVGERRSGRQGRRRPTSPG